MADDKFELTRRKALAGLGTIGVASAGAGLGTSAYFNDTESFTGNSMTAGELDLTVEWWNSVDQGGATIDPASKTSTGTMNGDDSYTYEINDAKPGDEGTLAFCPSIDGNPGYVQVVGTDLTQEGGTNPEPEQEAEGDDDNDADLAENIDVEVYYADSVSMNDGQVSCDKVDTDDNESPNDAIFDGTLLEFYNDFLRDDNQLDGDLNNGFDDGDAYVASDDETAGNEGINPCLCIEWSIDAESVGNVIQGDTLSLDFQFEAVQERHNTSASFPQSS